MIAHRGASSHAPENTLPAFYAALEANADLVELDYVHTADGVPVCFHDNKLDRTTNAPEILGRTNIPIRLATMSDLRRLDAGAWFGAEFAGTSIPTLAEALDVIQSRSVALIERKQGDPATCVKLLRDTKRIDRLIVQSFDWDFLAACHRLEPGLALAALGDKDLTDTKLDAIARTGSVVVGWDHRRIGRPAIEAIHRRGWKAWVFTVNEPNRAVQLVTEGADAIITDDPALMWRHLAGGNE